MNLAAIDFSSLKLPLIVNLPSLEQVDCSMESKLNVGGTEASFEQSLTSLFWMAWSVKTGLRRVSSSVGIPVISFELLSLNEVYPSVAFTFSRRHW